MPINKRMGYVDFVIYIGENEWTTSIKSVDSLKQNVEQNNSNNNLQMNNNVWIQIYVVQKHAKQSNVLELHTYVLKL